MAGDSAADNPARGRSGFLTAIPRALLWPFRRFFDPRFHGLAAQADSQHVDLVQRLDANQAAINQAAAKDDVLGMREELASIARAEMDASREATELMGRSLGDLLGETSAMQAALEELQVALRLGPFLRNPDDIQVETLGDIAATFLNYASSHKGFAAQKGFWFNPPISLRYEKGAVRPANTNERLVELPYAYRALARTDPGSSVLDVGATESLFAFSLASLGYTVTAIDLRPYPLSHPRLRSVEADILEWESDERFDAVACISTLEHIGLDVYGGGHEEEGRADRRAVDRFRALTRPGGLLVLTVPFGPASADETQRSYDRPELEGLLTDWSIEDLTIVGRTDDLTWQLDGGGEAAHGVALVTAVRPPD